MQQHEDAEGHHTEHDANFFDPANAEHTARREQLAMDTLEELLHWLLSKNGTVGILGIPRSLFFPDCRCHELHSS